MGTAYRGPVREMDGVTLHPSNLRGGDVYGGYGCARLVAEVGAADVLVLKDLWMLKNCAVPFRDLPDGARVTAYVPLDGRLQGDALVEAVTFVDTLVAFTAFARDQFDAALARLGAEVETATIPHGVDLGLFRAPEPGTDAHAELRRRSRGRMLPHVATDAFVVLNANRPVARKRLDLTIAGFGLFAQGKRDVHLRLHHAHLSEVERETLLGWIHASGAASRISLSPPGAVPDADLAALYAACDVGLNTSDGEGWGLVPFEHAAMGGAQVVPGNSASAELWAGAAEVVPAPERYVPPYTPLEVAAVTAEGVAEALDRLYVDPAHRQRIALAGYHRAHAPAFRWDAIADQWRRLLA